MYPCAWVIIQFKVMHFHSKILKFEFSLAINEKINKQSNLCAKDIHGCSQKVGTFPLSEVVRNLRWKELAKSNDFPDFPIIPSIILELPILICDQPTNPKEQQISWSTPPNRLTQKIKIPINKEKWFHVWAPSQPVVPRRFLQQEAFRHLLLRITIHHQHVYIRFRVKGDFFSKRQRLSWCPSTSSRYVSWNSHRGNLNIQNHYVTVLVRTCVIFEKGCKICISSISQHVMMTWYPPHGSDDLTN